MTLRQTRTVDWLCIEKGSANVVLSLVDEEDWEDERIHLELLEAKLNSYLAFIESGEVYDQLAQAGRIVDKATPIRVDIIAKHTIPPQARMFLEYATNMFQGAGFKLTHVVRAAE